MTRSDIHHTIYILGLMALMVCLPLSHFGIGLSSFILFLNWMVEWNWTEKWMRIKRNKEGLLFAGLFVVYLLGLIKTDNWSVAAHNILSKVPLLLSPIIVISSRLLTVNERCWIFKTFIFSTVFCCFYSTIYWCTHDVADIRAISVFIDHIRFSLCIVLSIVFCTYLILQQPQKKIAITNLYGFLALVQIAYLFIAQTLTGVVILSVLLVVFIFYVLFKMPSGKFKVTFAVFVSLLLFGGIGYVSGITYLYYHDNDKVIASTTTAMGNIYDFDENTPLENGHRVGYYVCRSELEEAWKMRSNMPYDNYLEQTLIRYLNSKGLHKDYDAVMHLNAKDIRNVEKHIANYDYTRRFGLRKSLYQTYFCISIYKQHGFINGSSLLERFELWSASVAVIRDNWFLGVGVGDYKAALDNQLQQQNSSISYRQNRGSHNQWLTFWMMSGVITVLYFLFLFIYPFIKMRDKVSILFFALSLLIFISMLAEDTLESQTGRMLYAIFMPLMLFSEKKESD